MDALDDLGISVPSNVKVRINYSTVDGDQTVDIDDAASTNYSATTGLTPSSATNGSVRAVLRPKKVDQNNDAVSRYVQSAQLVFYKDVSEDKVPGGFELNDITISYSAKSIK